MRIRRTTCITSERKSREIVFEHARLERCCIGISCMRPPDPVASKPEESRRENVDEDENVGRDSRLL